MKRNADDMTLTSASAIGHKRERNDYANTNRKAYGLTSTGEIGTMATTTENNAARFLDSPLTRCSHDALPLLIEAYSRLHDVGAPKATRIAERIGTLLEELLHVAGDVEAYGNKWTGGEMSELADKIRGATQEYNAIADLY